MMKGASILAATACIAFLTSTQAFASVMFPGDSRQVGGKSGHNYTNSKGVIRLKIENDSAFPAKYSFTLEEAETFQPVAKSLWRTNLRNEDDSSIVVEPINKSRPTRFKFQIKSAGNYYICWTKEEMGSNSNVKTSTCRSVSSRARP